MKKMIAMLLAMAMIVSCMACGGSETGQNAVPNEETDSGVEKAPEADTSDDSETADTTDASAVSEIDFSEFTEEITPLEEPVDLNVCIGICILHDLPSYLAYKTGLLEQYGINANMVTFANGPLMVEAMSAGSIDCGGYGLGGILSGVVQGITDVLWVRTDEGAMQQYYAPNDSEIVAAGVNPDTGFYGTAEDWEKLNVFVAPGTAQEYVFGVAMDELGLSIEDLDITYMDNANCLTALYAGQGDAWSITNTYGYTAYIMDGYTKILDGTNVGAEVYAASVASKAALQDETKKEAIYTWLECTMAVTEWMKASEDNMKIATEYLVEWCEDQGVDMEGADVYAYATALEFFDLEDQLELFADNGEGMLNVEDSVMGNFDYYVQQGNYQESDRELVLDGDFNPEFVEYLADKYGL